MTGLKEYGECPGKCCGTKIKLKNEVRPNQGELYFMKIILVARVERVRYVLVWRHSGKRGRYSGLGW